MIVSSIAYEGAFMSVVSPKTLRARSEVSAILIRHSCNMLTLAEAEHALWQIVNGLTDSYDEGYNAGFRAHEERAALNEQATREPEFREVEPGKRRRRK